ncbi:MAG TPA: transposase, partial [Micromonosporaceae bacterium]
MRVYCGLAASEPVGPQNANEWLTAAVVDDAGRLLDVCDFGDDAVGYAELGALLAERSGDGGGVAVATDSDEHHVTRLLAAAGRPLAIVDDETLADYADRFADDESADEIDAGPAERHAVGLARALAAGALAASGQVPPRELMALKPVLAAHASVATGRHGTAVALREVLRELYPAALRAYPDPAEPIPLAILDALPEPGLLGTTSVGRGRDAAVANDLAAAGVADAATIADAITALRVAIAETPRRTGIGKGTTAAVATTIREAVAAVRACDAAISALVGLLAEKTAPATVLAPVVAARPPLRAATAEPIEAPRQLQRRPRTAPAPQTPAPAPAARATRTPAARPATNRPASRPVTVVNPRAAAAPTDQAVPPPPPGITPIVPTQAPRGRVTAKMPPPQQQQPTYQQAPAAQQAP